MIYAPDVFRRTEERKERAEKKPRSNSASGIRRRVSRLHTHKKPDKVNTLPPEKRQRLTFLGTGIVQALGEPTKGKSGLIGKCNITRDIYSNDPSQ
ncbi:hypothetical protein BaRGS_00034166 [Batillaria attramentaria]|uniref:Uncharacterized protein n=1 Tax=Batillaria attramentaria TaxID=370345 RepID=A0ABD0JI07_9CAEN